MFKWMRRKLTIDDISTGLFAELMDRHDAHTEIEQRELVKVAENARTLLRYARGTRVKVVEGDPFYHRSEGTVTDYSEPYSKGLNFQVEFGNHIMWFPAEHLALAAEENPPPSGQKKENPNAEADD